MTIRRELIDELLKEYETPQDILGEGGLLRELTKAVIERCLETELETHLGYPKHGRKDHATGNTRNGSSQKTLKGEQGHIEIEVPRERQSRFEPQLVKKGQTRLEGFDEKILALYARGMTTRDIQAQLQELYRVEISPTLISGADRGRDGRGAEVSGAAFRACLPNCLCGLFSRPRTREPARAELCAVPGAGGRFERTEGEASHVDRAIREGAKFWLSVLTELQNRGVKDVFIACVDGLTGLPEAIEIVFPQTRVQLCMVHLMRNSLRYVSYKHMRSSGDRLASPSTRRQPRRKPSSISN